MIQVVFAFSAIYIVRPCRCSTWILQYAVRTGPETWGAALIGGG